MESVKPSHLMSRSRSFSAPWILDPAVGPALPIGILWPSFAPGSLDCANAEWAA